MDKRRRSNQTFRTCALAAAGLLGCEGDPRAERGPYLGTTACVAGVITDYSAELGSTLGLSRAPRGRAE
jgi:hypothetical protein